MPDPAAQPANPPRPSNSTSHQKADAEEIERTIPGVSFPVVGIGCSAGGLEALEAFFPMSHRPVAWLISSSSTWTRNT